MLSMCYVANAVQCDNHNTDTDVYRHKGTDGVHGHGSVPKGNNRQAGASGREELHLSLTSGEIQAEASIKVKG